MIVLSTNFYYIIHSLTTGNYYIYKYLCLFSIKLKTTLKSSKKTHTQGLSKKNILFLPLRKIGKKITSISFSFINPQKRKRKVQI